MTRERGRAMNALIAASTTEPTSTPWSDTRKPRNNFHPNGSSNHHCDKNNNDISGDHQSYRHHFSDAAAKNKPPTHHGQTTFDDGGDDDHHHHDSAVDQLLSSGGGRGVEAQNSLDLCSSTWKSVETMARALAVGQSVVSTISRCYSLPSFGRSGTRGAAAAFRQSAREAGTEAMHLSLLSGRFAAKALAVFRRFVSLNQRPERLQRV